MKKHLLILFLSIFLIGNYHVATDWCDDLADNSIASSATISDHDSDNDLCGHCGHLGLNVLVILPAGFELFEPFLSSNPQADERRFKSLKRAPPNPPPVLLS